MPSESEAFEGEVDLSLDKEEAIRDLGRNANSFNSNQINMQCSSFGLTL